MTALRIRLWATLLAAAFGPLAAAYEVMPAPAKGKPYPGDKQTLPYEDVLDNSDLVLVGTLKSAADGRLELAVTRVLRGKFEKKEASVAFSGEFAEQPPEKGKPAVLLCIEQADGSLRLAADPPKGGGLLAEGEKLAERLLEAAADPAKGFASKDEAVKISSAYRLARAWVAAPEGKKPKLPAGLIEALIDGLKPDEQRGRNVNAAGRNALNLLLDCDISQLCRYSVTAPDDDRAARVDTVRDAWEAATAAAQKQLGVKAPAPEPPKGDDAGQIQKLIAQLGDGEWAKREEAEKALRAMGKKIEKELEAGAKSKDAEVSERCADLLKQLRNPRGEEPAAGPAQPVFDLKRVKLLIEAGAAK